MLAVVATGVSGAVALLLNAIGVLPTAVFVFSGVSIAGFAWITGLATEQLGIDLGPKASGVLNVAFGNAAELVITVFALRAGLFTLVKASLTGSILGNILLVLGLSMLCGGLRHGTQRFSRTIAGMNASMLTIAVIGLIVPAVFAQSLPAANAAAVVHLSTGIAVVLIVTYFLSLIFFFNTPEAGGKTIAEVERPSWGIGRSLAVLAVAVAGLAVLSEVLVHAVEPTLHQWHLSEAFVGLILVPIVGNAAEHLISVQFSLRNDMEFSMVVSLGSSLQIALFVAPLLVFISHLMGTPLNLVFTPLEIITVALGVVIVTIIANDGRSNWLEGSQLIAVYAVVALAFWFYP
jgi:Ca2+:H+ antiporter